MQISLFSVFILFCIFLWLLDGIKQNINDDDDNKSQHLADKLKKQQSYELPDMTGTCRNAVLRVSEVTCAGECPDESERQDQLHHDE